MVQFLAQLNTEDGWISSDVRQRRRIFIVRNWNKIGFVSGHRLRWLTVTTYKGYDIYRLSRICKFFVNALNMRLSIATVLMVFI